MKKITTETIKKMKEEGRKIRALTCYSYSMARLLAKSDIDLILVGDSMGMVELGYQNTIPVTVEDILQHSRAVARAGAHSLLAADMPFMSYNIDMKETLRTAGRLIKEGGAEAVKIEGGRKIAETAACLADNNIPVMGHIGLTPQSLYKFGGYKVQGKDQEAADALLEDAIALENAGVFSIVLECMPASLAEKITKSVKVPTIGIGAGRYCDGQILVLNDIIGLDSSFQPKYVRKYLDMEAQLLKAFKNYSEDVSNLSFPSDKESY